MVPSWTETLIEAGVNVVGRTRFCIHPKTQIPVVGGTKDWNLAKIASLKPDFILLDKEENPIIMSEQCTIPYLTTHITSLFDVPPHLRILSNRLANPKLNDYANDWEDVLHQRPINLNGLGLSVPGLIKWGRKPSAQIKKIIYIIWKNPWMSVSSDTFIGSMLSHCGLGMYIDKYEEKYPCVDLESFTEKTTTLLLFSSEPYPFLKQHHGLNELGFPYAFVNGEALSWFGLRSLQFLKNYFLTDIA